MDSCELEGGACEASFRYAPRNSLIQVMSKFIPLLNSDMFSCPNLYHPFVPVGCKGEEKLSSALPVSCGLLFVGRKGGVGGCLQGFCGCVSSLSVFCSGPSTASL